MTELKRGSVSLGGKQIFETEQVLVSLDALVLCLGEQFFRSFGERTCKGGVTCLVEKERTVVLFLTGLGVEGEGVLALRLERRIKAEQIPKRRVAESAARCLILCVRYLFF